MTHLFTLHFGNVSVLCSYSCLLFYDAVTFTLDNRSSLAVVVLQIISHSTFLFMSNGVGLLLKLLEIQ